MATISTGNQLYLYQLFVREVGVGKQTMLARMEEVLLADDIWPSDLGCSDVKEVLQSLDAFVRLTVFKKGRVYATVLAQPAWDEILERAESDAENKPAPGAKAGAKSWKRKKARKDPRPAKPRPKGRPQPVEEEPAAEEKPVQTTEPEPAAEPEPVAEVEQPVTEAEPELVADPEPIAEPEPAATEKTDPQEAAPQAEPEPQAEAEAVAEAEPEPQPAPAPEPSIRFTVTYDPYADQLPEEPSLAPVAPQPPAPEPQQLLPQSMAADVRCNNDQLAALYRLLPLDVDPWALLDEDWQVARSTETYVREGGTVTFPLRYLHHKGGEPVRVSLRRTTASPSGKRWAVSSIDTVDDVGFDGLPTDGQDLMRKLAQFAMLGPWDALTKQLEDAMSPYDAEALAGNLQEYLCTTFCRVVSQQKLATYDQRSAFDTGLLTADGQPILMCFAAQVGSISWRFDGFHTPEEAQLEGPAPQPASYIDALTDIMLTPSTTVRMHSDLLRALGPTADKDVELAVRRAQRDYRLATPAYDALVNEVRLLLPLELAGEGPRALVLRPTGDGFEACAILPLQRAAACARIVSRDLPRWLA